MPKRWFAYFGRKLKGPFTLDELKVLDGFGPDIEVTADDGEEFWRKAGQDKTLKKLFAPAARSKPKKTLKKRFLVCPCCGVNNELEEGRRRTHCSHCESPLTFKKGKGKGGALLTTLCPSCGVTVEYPEDSRTAYCAHCDSYLLVMGEDRLYRFYLPPSVSKEDLLAKGFKNPRLHFVPYWRYSAMVFYWNIGLKTSSSARFGTEDMSASDIANMDGLLPSAGILRKRVRDFRTRRLDSSLRASAEDIGYPAIGPRAARMALKPYHGKEMRALGEVLHVVVPRKEAEKKIGRRAYMGFKDSDLKAEFEHGAILNPKLSVLYMPFWVLSPASGAGGIVDGITGENVKFYGGDKAQRPLVEGFASPPRPVLARCERCDGELKIRNFQSLFVCPGCQLIWKFEGGKLRRQPVKIVAPGTGRRTRGFKNTGLYLPLWRMRVELSFGKTRIADQRAFRKLVPDIVYTNTNADPAKPVYIYCQAWGNMVYPRLSKVPLRYTRKQPELKTATGTFDRMVRAVYGPKTALDMPMLTLIGVVHLRRDLTRSLKEMKIEIKETELLLIPCADGHGETIEGVLGMAVRKRELSELRR